MPSKPPVGSALLIAIATLAASMVVTWTVVTHRPDVTFVTVIAMAVLDWYVISACLRMMVGGQPNDPQDPITDVLKSLDDGMINADEAARLISAIQVNSARMDTALAARQAEREAGVSLEKPTA